MKSTAFRSGLLMALLLAGPWAQAQTNAEDVDFDDELVHSDVPLYGYKDNLVPEHFSDDDGFGCMSRVAWGDWTLKRNDLPDDDPEWFRLQNYGVMHCAIVESRSHSRDRLDESGYRYSFFVEIGKTRIADKPVELWVLQSGTRPGSDYLLLARTPANGIINSFDVLQSRCPATYRREGPNVDIWSTAYCAINGQQNLLALAKSMATRPPLGKLTFVGEIKDKPLAEPAAPASE